MDLLEVLVEALRKELSQLPVELNLAVVAAQECNILHNLPLDIKRQLADTLVISETCPLRAPAQQVKLAP